MYTAAIRSTRPKRSGFTLIEILIVVVILGILASLVVAQFTDVSQSSEEAAVRAQLRRIRTSLEIYRVNNAGDPAMIVSQWTPLVAGNYLQQAPVNALNGSSVVAGAPAVGVGWVWRDEGNGQFEIYGVNASGTAEFVD